MNNRPVMREKYIDPRILAQHIDELTRQPRSQEMREEDEAAMLVTAQHLTSGLEKKLKGIQNTDEELAARLDMASAFVTNETRQAEALENYQLQKQAHIKGDIARERAIRKGREYEN